MTVGWKNLITEVEKRTAVRLTLMEMVILIRKIDWIPKRKRGKHRVWTLVEVMQIAFAAREERLTSEGS